MRTVKRNLFRSGVYALLGSLVLFGSAQAQVTSDSPAGLVVFPEVVIGDNYDTVIQLSNVSDQLIHVRCYLVNANSHCSNNPSQVCDNSDECGGGICGAGWSETDFRFTLTRHQPIMWRVSQGLQNFPLDGLNNVTQDGEYNMDSNIPPAPEAPFTGELKCFEVDSADNPVAQNDLTGEATIITAAPGTQIDASKYNAVGLPSTGFNDGNDTLCLGGQGTPECPQAEYQGCPNVVIVDHDFDGIEPVNGSPVHTALFIAPCSEDFLTQSTFKTTIQFLVFNEFEQRLSTSIRIRCFKDIVLSDIDTRPGPADDQYSIFNVGVQGTLTGQSRLRAVQTNETDVGHGIIVTAEKAIGTPPNLHYAAYNVDEAGTRDQTDILRVPRQ